MVASWRALRRLSLGIVLIVTASAVLLLADLWRRQAGTVGRLSVHASGW